MNATIPKFYLPQSLKIKTLSDSKISNPKFCHIELAKRHKIS